MKKSTTLAFAFGLFSVSAVATADDVRLVGTVGDRAAVLISGRFENANGNRRCRDWVGHRSNNDFIGGVGNWLSNALFDGCNSEVATFAADAAPALRKPERRWTRSAGDSLPYAAFPSISVPTTVWVNTTVGGSTAPVRQSVNAGFAAANAIYANSRCGIDLDVRTMADRTEIGNAAFGCDDLKARINAGTISYHPNRMNIYVVNDVGNRPAPNVLAGAACVNVRSILIQRNIVGLGSKVAHEYGHHFDLWHTHTASRPTTAVSASNIMSKASGSPQNRLTAGQCYRVAFSEDSYINKYGLRGGRTKQCRNLVDADSECPGLKNEF